MELTWTKESLWDTGILFSHEKSIELFKDCIGIIPRHSCQAKYFYDTNMFAIRQLSVPNEFKIRDFVVCLFGEVTIAPSNLITLASHNIITTEGVLSFEVDDEIVVKKNLTDMPLIIWPPSPFPSNNIQINKDKIIYHLKYGQKFHVSIDWLTELPIAQPIKISVAMPGLYGRYC